MSTYSRNADYAHDCSRSRILAQGPRLLLSPLVSSVRTTQRVYPQPLDAGDCRGMSLDRRPTLVYRRSPASKGSDSRAPQVR